MVGISTTSFLAVITMSSLAIGLAMQGVLKDLAAGVMLYVTCIGTVKPWLTVGTDDEPMVCAP